MCLKSKGATMMRCTRCGAVLQPTYPLQYQALFETAQLWEEPTFYCVACGEYVDRTILRNRARQAASRIEMEVAR